MKYWEQWYFVTELNDSVDYTGFKLGEAASQIAQKLGGDTEKTERELLEIYLGRAVKDPDHAGVTKESEINMK